MNKTLLLTIILACFALAPTITDQLDADFTAGTTLDINITNNSIILNNTGGNYTATGTFTSTPHHLGSNPVATISWTYTSPTGTSILLNTRAGPTPTINANWSGWSSNHPNSTGSTISNEQAFIQYRATLATTNNSRTPTINSVSITYTEQGPLVEAAASQNAQLNEDTSGDYRFYTNITETLPLNNYSGRYRIGSDAYTTYNNLTLSGNYYYLDITEPIGGWSTRENELLSINIYVQNNQSDENNITFSDLIDNVNRAPVLNPISNNTATEGVTKYLYATGSDPDGGTINFTSTHGTVTKTSATQATITWTPSNNETGIIYITIGVTDGNLTDEQTIAVNVTDVNDAPVMQTITSISGHYGDRIVFEVEVHDNDTNQNLTYTVSPNLFDVNAYTNPNETNPYAYHARSNFSALDDFEGTNTFTFWVSDGIATDSTNATLTITYCGDNICQSQENTSSCDEDCGTEESSISYLAIEVPDRICTNATINITTYNASSRYTCFYEGKTKDYKAFCMPIDDTDLTILRINKDTRSEVTTLSTGENGKTTWTASTAGEYKIVGEREDLIGTAKIITIKNCLTDINNQQEIIEYDKPNIEPKKTIIETPPQLERPSITPEQISLLGILIWYIIIPLLAAGLIYVGNEYYTLYKDTDPKILRTRIWMWETKTRYEPVVKPYTDAITKALGPIMKPVWNFTNNFVILPLKHMALLIYNAIKNVFKR